MAIQVHMCILYIYIYIAGGHFRIWSGGQFPHPLQIQPCEHMELQSGIGLAFFNFNEWLCMVTTMADFISSERACVVSLMMVAVVMARSPLYNSGPNKYHGLYYCQWAARLPTADH